MIEWDAIRAEIKRRRAAAGLSQRALAEQIGVMFATIARIESGVLTPSLDMLSKLAGGLRCSVHDLIIERRSTRPRKNERGRS